MNIPAADLARLNDCRHHDPHGFYGWHEGTVRTRQPGATAVQLHTPTQSLSMNLVGDDIWEAEVGENCDYRLEISYPGAPTRTCLLYTSPSPRDQRGSRMPSSA